jgi:hypothetical protein
MSKMIQVRDVPDRVHSTLKARSAREGMTLSDFIKRELARVAERPSLNEWLERTEHLKPVRTRKTAVQAIRQLRDSR